VGSPWGCAVEPPAPGDAQSTSAGASQHVAPEPPEHPMPAMSYSEMVRTMQMDDTARAGRVLLDQLEWRSAQPGRGVAWEGEAWYGGDYEKLSLRTEGAPVRGTTEDARIELFWDRIITRWWNLQLGARESLGNGPARTWFAAGVQGLAPQWFDIEATLYAGEAGRSAARLRGEYDLFLTQRLIVQPEAELNLYGRADPARQLGSGLSDLDLGLRVRYEFRREIAPYVGIAWRRLFGGTADRARAAGVRPSDVQFVAGLRCWL
jgi:copper resistance protein B